MANTSATGGLLTPLNPPAPPLEGSSLVDFIQAWVAGLSGLAGSLVRPRWQEEPPNLPKDGVTWAAIGITKRVADTNAAELHYPGNQGYNEIRRHEVITFLVSFYGPQAEDACAQFREGAQVAQNREILSSKQMGFVESSDIVVVPEMVKEKWLYRVDIHFSIRRQVVRQYGILNLLASEVDVDNEHYVSTVQIVP